MVGVWRTSRASLAQAAETGGLPHVQVGTVPIFAGSAEHALSWCTQRIQTGMGGTVATANLDFLAIARKDAAARELLEKRDLVVADGAPVAWLAKLLGARMVQRLSGVDLVDSLLGATQDQMRLFLYGSDPEISAAATERIMNVHRNVRVVGRISPPFRPLSQAEEMRDMRTIADSKPHIVLVALGFPKQEHVITRYYQTAPYAIWIGIGGTLDFYAGHRHRAPRWIQRIGLEWSIRLAQEPSRLWRRYLLRDIPEAARCLAECTGTRIRRAKGSAQRLN